MKAEVLAEGSNIRIRGRGILDGSDWEWRKGPIGNLIAIRNGTNVEVSGITLRGSSHWTIVPQEQPQRDDPQREALQLPRPERRRHQSRAIRRTC